MTCALFASILNFELTEILTHISAPRWNTWSVWSETQADFVAALLLREISHFPHVFAPGVDRWYWTQCFASRESSKKWEEPWPLIFPARPSKMLQLDECLHGQFWPRDPIKDNRSAKRKTSYGWYSTIAAAPRMEGWLWPLVTVAGLHRLWSLHKDSTWDSVNKKYSKPAVSHWIWSGICMWDQ